jgi:hypothetical protein
MTSHLVGVAEIAEMLGVSRQRAVQIVASYADYPAPEVALASGRVWRRSDVDRWISKHPIRPPGRPSTSRQARPADGPSTDDEPPRDERIKGFLRERGIDFKEHRFKLGTSLRITTGEVLVVYRTGTLVLRGRKDTPLTTSLDEWLGTFGPDPEEG